jgi:DNA ligase-1
VPLATLLQFAQVSDQAAATTKKLQKYAILGDYFRGIEDDEDLRRAVRFSAGRAFAATDERVINVGGALVSEVVLELLKLDPEVYRKLARESGEIGEGISKVWPERTTDHPLTLGDLSRGFETLASNGSWESRRGVLLDLFSRCTHPREAAYLAKIISGDLRTGVQEGVLHDAIAKAFDRDRPTVQRCQLLVGDLGDVAVLAKHDACGTAKFDLFHPVQFMLATPVETSDDAAAALDGQTFYAEDKLDGIRAQVHKSGDRVAIYTRTMDRTDASFPDVVEAIRKLPGDFLLDGEIVPWCDGCVMPFAHIQKRLGRKVLRPKILRDNPAAFIAFDILYKDGELVMDLPLVQRRKSLESLALLRLPNPLPEGEGTGQLLTTSIVEVTTSEQVASVFDAARNRRNEGVILKDPASLYSPGRRGQMWFKLKTHLPTLDCVVTAAEYGHGKRRGVLSDYTFAVWDREPAEDGAALVNVGKAYSGVTDEEIAQLTELFLKISRANLGRVHAVEPKVVLEIACDQIQTSNRHASGYAFRFPRIKRIRWDKRPEDADRLSRVIEIYQSTHNFGRSNRPPEPVPVPEPTLFDL